MVRLVSGMVQNGDLDEPSELVFLAFLRRHDHYTAALRDSKPEELQLQYGPSLNHPNSSCLYACRRDNPRVRLDVGVDKTFADGLKAYPDQDVQSNAKRRLAAAIREETRPVRDLAKTTHPPFCVGCNCPLNDLLLAQGQETSPDGQDAEFHHVVPVELLAQSMYADGTPPVFCIVRAHALAAVAAAAWTLEMCLTRPMNFGAGQASTRRPW
jgi:hypothetical protein